MTSLLVAVDGSEANRAALDWAIAEAVRTRQSLNIVVVVEPWQVPDRDPPSDSDHGYVRPIVQRATDVATARLDPDRVTTVVVDGPASAVLVDLAEAHSGLVVGKRGLGAISRILIGSTSIAVAGRSAVPVTIVPDTWDGAGAAARPVLLGLDLAAEHDAAVRHAFTQAQSRGVSLRVLQGWQAPPIIGAMSGDHVAYFEEWRKVCRTALQVYLERLGQEFTDVHVAVDQVHGHPVDVLVDAAAQAQLLVLGREEKTRWTGFALGSVARGVLPHSDIPVTVVPA